MIKGVSYPLATGVLAALTLSACSRGNDSPASSTPTPAAPTSLSVAYLNTRDSSSPVALSVGSRFPADSITPGAGQFDQVSTCDGSPIVFKFRLTNTGTGSLTAGGTPAVAVTDTTTIVNGLFNSSNFSATITDQPDFPLAAGASTTFDLTVANVQMGGAANCVYGGSPDPGVNAMFVQNLHLVIHTNDAVNPDFALDLALFGQS